MIDYRPIDPQDHGEYRRFTRYGFAAERGPLEAGDDQQFETELFDLRGVYDGGLKSGCKRYDFEAYVRDGVEQVGGLGAAVTPPEYRRQGYVRELCREACREWRGEGVGLVVLWPFSTPFYRNLGWATASDFYEFELAPTALPEHDQRGSYQRLDADDWEQLRPVEAAFNDGVTLSMRRSEAWWRERTLTNWTGGAEPFVYGYERDGRLAGYLVYTVDDEGDDRERTLSVSASGHVDEEAHRSLLEFLRHHGAQIDAVELRRPVGSRLLDLVDDPDSVTCERVAGPMARLTGLEPLDDLGWETLDRPMALVVEDPLLAENDGLVCVSEDGIEEISGGDPDVHADIGTLTQLYLGRYDPAAAERYAGLTVATDSFRDTLADVFPQRQVFLPEFF